MIGLFVGGGVNSDLLADTLDSYVLYADVVASLQEQCVSHGLSDIYLAPDMKTEKKLNKWLVSFIIGGTILGLTGLSMSSRGRGILGRLCTRLGNLFKLFHDAAKSLGERLGK